MALRPILAAILALASVPAAAGTVTTRTWTDAQGTRWTETTTVETDEVQGASRLIDHAAPSPVHALARYGPFVVIDAQHAALIDATDAASPARFAAMVHAWPGLRVLEMIDCPGTIDDVANLQLGRMIHDHAMITDVPPGGSVRSGAVDLFVAGVSRHAAGDAEFGVHAWADDTGREPGDYAADAEPNAAYLAYYRAVGMSAEQAQRFYAMTNSVPNAQVRWLHTADMARYVPVN